MTVAPILMTLRKANIVREMLGHSTIAITTDFDSHHTPSLQAEAAAKLDTFLRQAMPAMRAAGE